MKKIAIIGEFYSTNLGDAAIVDTVKNMVESNGIEAEIFDFGARSNWNFDIEVKHYHGILKVAKKIIHPLYLNINKTFGLKNQRHRISDYSYFDDINSEEFGGVIFAGGQLFSDYFVKEIINLVKLFSNREINISFNSIGIGKISDENIDKLCKCLKNPKVKYISMRDGSDLLKDRGITVTDSFDSVVSNSFIFSDLSKINFAVDSCFKNKIGLGIMKIATKEDKLLEFWKSLINNIEKLGYEWEIFTNGDPWDNDFGEQLLKYIGRKDKSVLAPKEWKDLVKIIQSFDKIMSFRMHSHIIAYSYNIPSFAFSWDKKIETFFFKIGHPNRATEWKRLNFNPEIIESLTYNNWDDEVRKRQNELIKKEIKIQVCKLLYEK
ncbi:polysaccharide pyruvyl transferase family protein [Lactococcus lactis]|uniref:polysaccharide pyruvyl transferase family protein n=1 Tax=Lactococcus lactis TaxID=1358 RepID=UPI002074973C|nr:polysaccharide pyruvyl transferase family protein [Lactococcus lactis]